MDEFAGLNIDYVKGRKICATGRLFSMTHRELATLVESCGGTYVRTPTRSSLILVVGDDGWPSEADGSMSQVFDRARQLRAYGYAIEFTAENQFLENLGFIQSANAIRGPHTLADLSRLLDISVVRLRRWLRLGLIRAEATKFQIPYFNLRQVAFVKQLRDAADAGTSIAELRRGIEQTRELLPHDHSLYELCSQVEHDGRLLLRLNGRLLDHSGQNYFDFGAQDDPTPLFAEAVRDGFHDLCDQALAYEEEGDLAAAAATYHRALQLQPSNPTLHFDLGNVEFELGNIDSSIDHFRKAIAHDDEFALAWHNLGSVYACQGLWDEAESALRRALQLVPTYADSHCTLAEVLRSTDRNVEAARHEHAYHQYSKADRLLAGREHFLRVFQSEEEARQTS